MKIKAGPVLLVVNGVRFKKQTLFLIHEDRQFTAEIHPRLRLDDIVRLFRELADFLESR
jgi:hypothetical protein